MVNSAAEAREMARAAKYPPLGCRSMGGDAAWHYGDDYPERANQETLLLVQVEHIDSVDEVEEIMATPGVDGCFIGPTDLALSMGCRDSTTSTIPIIVAAMARTLAACQAPRQAGLLQHLLDGQTRKKDRRRASTASPSSRMPICS